MTDNYYEAILENLYNRCNGARLINYIHPKLEAFNLLLCFRCVCQRLEIIIKNLENYLPFDKAVFVDYEYWLGRFNEIRTLDISDFKANQSSNPKYIIDYIFRGSLIDNNRESAEEIRRAIDILTSDVYMRGKSLERALYYAKLDLQMKLATLKSEIKKRKTNEFHIKMVDKLFEDFSLVDEEGNEEGKFKDDYEEWKYNCDDVNNEILETHLWTLIYNLISTNFIVFDKGLYVKHKADEYFEEAHFDLVDEVTIDEEALKKKYYVFRTLVAYENGKFILKDKNYLGKYLIKNNDKISIVEFTEFKYFLDSISLIYADMTFDEVVEEEVLSEQDSKILAHQ